MEIDWMQGLRVTLIYLHLLALLASVIAIAFADYAVFRGEHVDTPLLQKSMRAVMWGLVGLWLTGLAVVTLDTSWRWDELASRPKMLAKLVTVSILTLNGVLLHHWVFPQIIRAGAITRDISLVACVTGAVSAVTWGFAAFLGVAGPFTPLLGFAGFEALHGLCLFGAVLVAVVFVRPRLIGDLDATGAAEKKFEQPDVRAYPG